jgi:hypothetical protein
VGCLVSPIVFRLAATAQSEQQRAFVAKRVILKMQKIRARKKKKKKKKKKKNTRSASPSERKQVWINLKFISAG